MKALLVLLILTFNLYSEEQVEVKAGLGIGVGYGWIGSGFEVERNQFSVYAGFGWAFLISDDVEATYLGWDAGIKYFFRSTEKTFRPSIQAGLGNLYVYNYGFTDRTTGQLTTVWEGSILGLETLLGLDFDFGQPGGIIPGLGMGLGIPLQDLPRELRDAADISAVEIDEIETVITISLGIKYQF